MASLPHSRLVSTSRSSSTEWPRIGARGMEVAGAVDTRFVGEDIGKVCDMEPLEIPIINDLNMVLGSISQSKETGVVVDFTEPSTVYDNVKQATAFGMKSVVYVPRISLETVLYCQRSARRPARDALLRGLLRLDPYCFNKPRSPLRSTTTTWKLWSRGPIHGICRQPMLSK